MSDTGNQAFIPEPSWLSQPFWDNANNGVLSRQKCAACGFEMFPPQFACRRCLSTTLDWIASSGKGSLYSFVVLHMGADGSPLAQPKILADVDLQEGWHMMTNIVDCPVDRVRCDMAVAVTWQRLSCSINLPVFAPLDNETRPDEPRP